MVPGSYAPSRDVDRVRRPGAGRSMVGRGTISAAPLAGWWTASAPS